MIHTVPRGFTAFLGHQRLVSGPLPEVALAVLKASQSAVAEAIVIFDDANGRPIDLDLRGTERDIVARLPQPASNPETLADDPSAAEPPGPGRPKPPAVPPHAPPLPRHRDCPP